MNGKKPWVSKQLWMNVIALVGILVFRNESFIADNLEVVNGIMIVLNILLRAITKEPINWT